MALSKAMKTKWLKALRGRKYKQGIHALNDTKEGTHCVLGVFCDLSTEVFAKGINRFNQTIYYCDECPGILTSNTVPPMVKDAPTSQQQIKITSMNDNGKTFKELADYIEKNF